MDKLEYYRKRLDLIDKKIVKLLLFRFDLVRKIGSYKGKNNIKVINKKREMQVINNIKEYSNKRSHKFIINIFKKIIEHSKRIQR